MGKYKHEGKGRNISVGGGQERKDLFKDMSGGYNAMGDSNSPNYKYNGSAFKQRYSAPMEKHGPLHGNAFGHAMQKAGGDYDKAKSMLEMKGSHSPTYKNAPYKLMGDPNKKMDKLSARHKKLYDRFEMGQTSEKEEQRMFRLEDRMDKVGKKIKSKKSPLNQGKKKVKTLGEKETRQDRRAGKDNLRPGYFGVGGDDPTKTKLQRDAKERTSDPDYKKPKAETLKKSPLNQGFNGDEALKTLPGGNYPKPPFKPGVKADEDRTKKDKRKHKRVMKELGRLSKKLVKKNTSKK